MNPKQTTSFRWLTFAGACALSSNATAQQAVMSRYATPAAGDAFFSVYGANVGGHLVPRAQLTFDYERRAFVLTDAAGKELAVPSAQRSLLHAAASFSIARRVLVTADVPFALSQSGDTVAFGTASTLAPTQGSAIGELRLGARVRLFGGSEDPLQLALGGFVYLPTATDAWGGEGYTHAQPTMQLGGRFKLLRYGAHLGAHLRPSEDPTSLTYGAALGLSLLDDALLIGPEVQGSFDVTDGVPIGGVLDLSSGAGGEVIVGGQYRFLKHFVAGIAGGSGFSTAIGTPEVRGLVRFGYVPVSADAGAEPPPPLDSDGDGFFDPKDACPAKPGIASVDPAKNGCPPPPADRDGDSFPDKADACADVPGVANSDPKKSGCPADTDEDGTYDADDGCPSEAGSKDTKGDDRGCPDKDKDTIADRSDACAGVFGFPNANAKRHGCPRAEINAKEIVINQRIEFETDKTTILEESFPILDAVAALLEENPDVTLLEVQGHADDAGEMFKNILLSHNRAKAVVEGIATRGVSRARLTPKGYGSTRPIESGTSEDARKKNRRVEFKIVLRKPGQTKTN